MRVGILPDARIRHLRRRLNGFIECLESDHELLNVVPDRRARRPLKRLARRVTDRVVEQHRNRARRAELILLLVAFDLLHRGLPRRDR